MGHPDVNIYQTAKNRRLNLGRLARTKEENEKVENLKHVSCS